MVNVRDVNLVKENDWKIDLQHLVIKLLKWVLFSVAAALLPIVINGLRQMNSGGSLNYFSLISHGELVLVCAAITAEAIGDMYMSTKKKNIFSLLVFGTCCLIFFLSSAFFVIAEESQSNISFIAISSIWIFLFTLFAGGCCKALAEA